MFSWIFAYCLITTYADLVGCVYMASTIQIFPSLFVLWLVFILYYLFIKDDLSMFYHFFVLWVLEILYC